MADNDENLSIVRDIAVKYCQQLDRAHYSALLNAADELERLFYDLDKCKEGSVIRTRINDKQVEKIRTLSAENSALSSFVADIANGRLTDVDAYQRARELNGSVSTRQEEIDDDWEGLEID